jgi:hypothetical protein
MESPRIDSFCATVDLETGSCQNCIASYLLQAGKCVMNKSLVTSHELVFDWWFWLFVIMALFISVLGVLLGIVTILKLRKYKI